MKQIYVIFSILLLVVTLSACSVQPDPYSPSGTYIESNIDLGNPSDIKPFTSEDDYQEFFSSLSSSNSYYYGGLARGGDLMVESVAMDGMAPMVKTTATNSNVGVSDDFSGTNNQVQGVDEADLLKTDGEFIYTITDNTIFVIKATPGEDSKVLSQVTLKDVYPSEMLLKGDKLVVIGRVDVYKFRDELDVVPENGMSFAYVYDVSDKESPKLVKELLFEGWYDTARLYDEAYVVTRVRPEIRDVYPLPMVVTDGVVSTLRPADMFYIPYQYNSPELAIVHKIDLDTYNVDSTAVTVDNLQTVYMSYDNIYVVGHESISEYRLEQIILQELIEPKLSVKDLDLIKKIKETDNAVLSQYEKEQKIQSIYMKRLYSMSSDEQDDLQDEAENLMVEKVKDMQYLDYVLIHKIDIDRLKVQASNKVPGQVVNQFSLDEYDGYLRIATTIPQRWSNLIESQKDESNNIYVLNKDLETVGSLTGLAENERIYSTRFVGDRLYMVTFRQVDPFFVIDLSNPKKPTSLGELKIPGFSRYLHPYDATHIIGIGQDATETGRTSGLKISLFDVEDVANPKEVAKYVTEAKYASSTALYEHKAFLFSKEKNLLVIPAYSYEWKDNQQSGYAGAFVFNIDESNIELRGLIDHTKGSNNIWNSQVERSLYIGDLLYTKSRNLLRINALEDLSSVKDVSLEVKQTGDIPIY
ncbi:beta-propeller domain-containing protein [Candidatus Woesearchaeota archaeon]|nr:beta-propeller domain-containing protein [Candidatus Woesearchaeota archaeon]